MLCKRIAMCIVLAIGIAHPVAFAQQHQQGGTKTSITGIPNNHGKTLMDDDTGKAWTVDNPNVLAKYDGQHVFVKGTAKGDTIHVESVRTPRDTVEKKAPPG
jgi:hypothetical protein